MLKVSVESLQLISFISKLITKLKEEKKNTNNQTYMGEKCLCKLELIS